MEPNDMKLESACHELDTVSRTRDLPVQLEPQGEPEALATSDLPPHKARSGVIKRFPISSVLSASTKASGH